MEVKNFCCNATLRTGGFIIGWGEVLLSAITIATMFYILPEESNEYEHNKLIVRITMNILLLLTALLLLLGCEKWKEKLLLPWIFVAIIYVFMKVYFITDLFEKFSMMDFIRDVVQVLLILYFIICIHSLYKFIQRDNDEECGDVDAGYAPNDFDKPSPSAPQMGWNIQ